MNPAIIGFVAIAAVGGLAVAYSIRAAAKRKEELAALARDNGVLYQEKADHLLPALAHLRLFSRGHSRKAVDLISDSAGEEFWLFEYRYVTGHGKNAHRHRMTVAAFPHLRAANEQGGSVELPAFELSREHIFHKIGQAFGFQDIDFPEHPSFSKRYLLRAQNEAAVRRLFDPGLLDFFDKVPEINVEAGGKYLIVYRAGKRVKPAEALAFLDEAAGVRDALMHGKIRAPETTSLPVPEPPAFI
jgi:hypothetical protein